MRSNLSEGPNSLNDCLSAKAATGGNPVCYSAADTPSYAIFFECIRTKMKRQTSTVCFFVLAADEDAEPTSRGCYSTKRYLKLNFKNTTSTQVTEASRIGFTKLAEPYLGYPLNISYSNQNSLGGDDNIPSFKSDGANGLRSTRI